MDFIIAIATGKETHGRALGNAFVVNNAIKTNPAYNNGSYKKQTLNRLAQGSMGQFLW
jgi:homoserine acetyltransferase